MTDDYKQHLIQATALQFADSKKWAVKVIVSWDEAANGELRQFDGPIAGFDSQGEAESWGMQFGRKWIDQGKPDLHKTT